MSLAWGLFLLGGLYPWYRAWRANRLTALSHALLWALAAWLAWALAIGLEWPGGRYLALCLTACAGVAVLGARRPGVVAWNFVVAGLLAVLLRPAALTLLTGLLWSSGEEGQGLRLDGAALTILGVALGVPLLNYLPTRLGPAAAALGLGCALEAASLAGEPAWLGVGDGLVAATPWLALGALGWGQRPTDEVTRLWRGFRDRFGLLWALRMREQFHRAARNAGCPAELGWGTARVAPEGREQALALLRATLRRFGPA
jgi:hypothetical protein